MIDLNALNPEQRAAVLQTDGPLLVLAGAGSGKTRVLTYRVAYLMENGVPPWKILAITFTNKAAREMAERVSQLAGEAADDAWISTFHSCCARILRRDIEKMGYKREFSIYDSDDSLSVIKAIIKEMNLGDKDFPPREIRSIISNAKNAMLSPEEWLKDSEGSARERKIYQVYQEYEKRLKACSALDFDDLLFKTLELLADNPPVLEYYQRKFDYILVDECQDTNKVQYELVALLAGDKRNVCMVGDDDQSIYGWRGANPRNMMQFEQDFPGCRVIKLEQNYRSTGNILDAANQVIAHNSGRKEKVLWTESGAGEQIALYRALDERDEAMFIAKMCRKLLNNGEKPGEIAVLYRTNAQSRVMEETFVRGGMPHRVYGGMRFYEREEVKDLLAYLRLLVNEGDDVATRRIINKPRRGIGEATVDALARYAASEGMSLLGATQFSGEIGLSTRAVRLVAGFADLMLDLTLLAAEAKPSEVLDAVIEKTDYVTLLEKANNEESAERIDNIKELMGSVVTFEQEHPEADLTQYLENVALFTDLDAMNETGGLITLMTLHSAKGLEFNEVFIAGMEENVFPLSRAAFNDDEMEEERRLAYVGITRAKKRLFLTHAMNRALYNDRMSNPRSRFVDEIPQRLITMGNLANQGGGRLQSVNLSTKPRPAPGVQKGFGGFGYAPKAPRIPVAAIPNYQAGEKVYHKIFGYGVVTEAQGEGEAQKITIHFERDGSTRMFFSKSVPLTKR